MKNQPQLQGRIWIESKDGTFLGHGRVMLLERIQEHGSISAAARSLEMSYRRAWQLVDSMNSQSKKPLVQKKSGGQGGGGAELTTAGENAIHLFWNTYDRFQNFLARESRKIDRKVDLKKGRIDK